MYYKKSWSVGRDTHVLQRIYAVVSPWYDITLGVEGQTWTSQNAITAPAKNAAIRRCSYIGSETRCCWDGIIPFYIYSCSTETYTARSCTTRPSHDRMGRSAHRSWFVRAHSSFFLSLNSGSQKWFRNSSHTGIYWYLVGYCRTNILVIAIYPLPPWGKVGQPFSTAPAVDVQLLNRCTDRARFAFPCERMHGKNAHTGKRPSVCVKYHTW